MIRETLARVLAAALLIGAALVAHSMSGESRLLADWRVLGWAVFGLINVVLTNPGTLWLRVSSVCVSLAGLFWPGSSTLWLAIVVWMVWPPAYMVSASLGRDSNPDPEDSLPDSAPSRASMRARLGLSALIGAVAVASIAYRWLVLSSLHQTAALFVGIPAILAIVVVIATSPRSAMGVALKAVTIGLLVSLVFLGEGMLCILMSAPLFYAVAFVVALVMKVSRRDEKPPVLRSCILLLVVLPMGLEGVTDLTTVNREESVTVSRIVHSSADAVEQGLLKSPRFDRVRPLYLRAGFPAPVATLVDNTSGTARWTVRFRGGETRLDGMEARAGDLVLELEEQRPGFARWRAISDSSHMTHFLNWRASSVRWDAIDSETTRVTWTLEYRRGLDPAWYFGPMERYAVRLAAGYLIDSVATP